jgi:hypothetical protein
MPKMFRLFSNPPPMNQPFRWKDGVLTVAGRPAVNGVKPTADQRGEITKSHTGCVAGAKLFASLDSKVGICEGAADLAELTIAEHTCHPRAELPVVSGADRSEPAAAAQPLIASERNPPPGALTTLLSAFHNPPPPPPKM